MIGFVRAVAYALLAPGCVIAAAGIGVLGLGAGGLLDLLGAEPLSRDLQRVAGGALGGTALIVVGLMLCGPGALLLAAAKQCELSQATVALLEHLAQRERAGPAGRSSTPTTERPAPRDYVAQEQEGTAVRHAYEAMRGIRAGHP